MSCLFNAETKILKYLSVLMEQDDPFSADSMKQRFDIWLDITSDIGLECINCMANKMLACMQHKTIKEHVNKNKKRNLCICNEETVLFDSESLE